MIQANEALKIVVGYGEPLVGRLLLFDAQSTTFEELKLKRDPECPTCGKPALSASASLQRDLQRHSDAAAVGERDEEPVAVADAGEAACSR